MGNCASSNDVAPGGGHRRREGEDPAYGYDPRGDAVVPPPRSPSPDTDEYEHRPGQHQQQRLAIGGSPAAALHASMTPTGPVSVYEATLARGMRGLSAAADDSRTSSFSATHRSFAALGLNSSSPGLRAMYEANSFHGPRAKWNGGGGTTPSLASPIRREVFHPASGRLFAALAVLCQLFESRHGRQHLSLSMSFGIDGKAKQPEPIPMLWPMILHAAFPIDIADSRFSRVQDCTTDELHCAAAYIRSGIRSLMIRGLRLFECVAANVDSSTRHRLSFHPSTFDPSMFAQWLTTISYRDRPSQQIAALTALNTLMQSGHYPHVPAVFDALLAALEPGNLYDARVTRTCMWAVAHWAVLPETRARLLAQDGLVFITARGFNALETLVDPQRGGIDRDLRHADQMLVLCVRAIFALLVGPDGSNITWCPEDAARAVVGSDILRFLVETLEHARNEFAFGDIDLVSTMGPPAAASGSPRSSGDAAGSVGVLSPSDSNRSVAHAAKTEHRTRLVRCLQSIAELGRFVRSMEVELERRNNGTASNASFQQAACLGEPAAATTSPPGLTSGEFSNPLAEPPLQQHAAAAQLPLPVAAAQLPRNHDADMFDDINDDDDGTDNNHLNSNRTTLGEEIIGRIRDEAPALVDCVVATWHSEDPLEALFAMVLAIAMVDCEDDFGREGDDGGNNIAVAITCAGAPSAVRLFVDRRDDACFVSVLADLIARMLAIAGIRRGGIASPNSMPTYAGHSSGEDDDAFEEAHYINEDPTTSLVWSALRRTTFLPGLMAQLRHSQWDQTSIIHARRLHREQTSTSVRICALATALWAPSALDVRRILDVGLIEALYRDRPLAVSSVQTDAASPNSGAAAAASPSSPALSDDPSPFPPSIGPRGSPPPPPSQQQQQSSTASAMERFAPSMTEALVREYNTLIDPAAIFLGSVDDETPTCATSHRLVRVVPEVITLELVRQFERRQQHTRTQTPPALTSRSNHRRGWRVLSN